MVTRYQPTNARNHGIMSERRRRFRTLRPTCSKHRVFSIGSTVRRSHLAAVGRDRLPLTIQGHMPMPLADEETKTTLTIRDGLRLSNLQPVWSERGTQPLEGSVRIAVTPETRLSGRSSANDRPRRPAPGRQPAIRGRDVLGIFRTSSTSSGLCVPIPHRSHSRRSPFARRALYQEG
jgi:hypothetical protein